MPSETFDPTTSVTVPAWTLAVTSGVALLLAGLGVRRRQSAGAGVVRSGTMLRQSLIGLAVALAIGVAVIGGVRSFEAVSIRFGSPLVPLTADGMIVACTALRIAALTRGWRLPGALVITYGFIVGTVWLNVSAARDWPDAIAHALAPLSYAVLVEMLAHLLRLHLHLAVPAQQRIAVLAWITSPVVTTRAWLHLARTGADDPAAARALVQQVVRMASRLRTVCPSSRWWPLGPARRARGAALQTIRDGLLTARQLAELLPDEAPIAPAALLARVDRAALGCTAPGRTGTPAPRRSAAAAPDRTGTQSADRTDSAQTVDGGGAADSRSARALGGSRSDAELLTELRRAGGPMSIRQVMRQVGVGAGRAKRLVEMAGWTSRPSSTPAISGERRVGGHHSEPSITGSDRSTPEVRQETRRYQ